MSAAILACTGDAGLLWLTGLILSLGWIGRQTDALTLLYRVPAVAVVWTAGIALYLVHTWLRRPDERRLVTELEAVCSSSRHKVEGVPSTPRRTNPGHRRHPGDRDTLLALNEGGRSPAG